MKVLTIQLLTVCLLFVGCSSDDKSKNEKPQSTAVEQTKNEAPKTVTLELASDDQMKFDKSELRVKAGQKVKLVLKHIGKMDKAVMGHNFILLKKGTDLTEFATLAMAAKDSEYIPESDAIIAHTKLIGGGESTTITFDAPEKGTYDYLCSFPGHFALMQGKFIVD